METFTDICRQNRSDVTGKTTRLAYICRTQYVGNAPFTTQYPLIGGRMAASITREQQRKVAIGCKLCLTCGETVRGTLRVRQDVGSYTVALAFNCSRAVPIETITAN